MSYNLQRAVRNAHVDGSEYIILGRSDKNNTDTAPPKLNTAYGGEPGASSPEPGSPISSDEGPHGVVAESIPRPAIILFHADAWCGPCQAFTPTWKKLCEQHATDSYVLYNMYEYDCSPNGSFESEKDHYAVRGYPTLVWQSAGGADAKWSKYVQAREQVTIRKFIFEKLCAMWDQPCRDQAVLPNATVGDIQHFVRQTLVRLEE